MGRSFGNRHRELVHGHARENIVRRIGAAGVGPHRVGDVPAPNKDGLARNRLQSLWLIVDQSRYTSWKQWKSEALLPFLCKDGRFQFPVMAQKVR